MKKNYIHLLIAIFAIAFVSCSKEIDAPVSDNTTDVIGQEEGESIQIIGTIIDGVMTKTQYTKNEGVYEFSWSRDAVPYEGEKIYKDEIHLIVYSNSAQNRYRLYADNAAKSTTFTGYANIGNVTAADWSQTGFALYPIEAGGNGNNVGIPRKDILVYGSNGTFDKVKVTLSSNYDLGENPDMNTQLSCTPLVGVRKGTTNEYEFSTAVGVLMITLNNIPATATGLKITSPNTALSGSFALESGSPEIKSDNYLGETVSDADRSRTITFSGVSSTHTFYIPIPTGTIPLVDGKGLQIQLLEDGAEYPAFSKSYTKELTIERNKIIPVTLASPDWKKLGTARFYNKRVSGIDATSYWDYYYHADVELQQNRTNPNQYRLVNPYKAYWEKNAVSMPYTSSDYLVFTVDMESMRVTNFENHNIGLNLDGNSGNVFIKYVNSEHNKVWQKDEIGNPLVVQLAPNYRYSGDGNGWTKNSLDHLVEIIFPDYVRPENIGLCSRSKPSESTQEFSLTGGTNKDNLETAILLRCYTNNDFLNKSSEFNAETGSASFSGYSGTGHYLRRYQILGYNSDGTEIYHEYKDLTVYVIESDNLTKYAHQYIGTSEASSASLGGGAVTTTITLAESDDALKGNVMITEFDGINYSIDESTHWDLNSNPANTHYYEINNRHQASFQGGSPIYGELSGSTITFINTDKQSLYKDNNSASHFLVENASQVDYTTLTVSVSNNVVDATATSSLTFGHAFLCDSYYNGSGKIEYQYWLKNYSPTCTYSTQ